MDKTIKKKLAIKYSWLITICCILSIKLPFVYLVDQVGMNPLNIGICQLIINWLQYTLIFVIVIFMFLDYRKYVINTSK